MRNKVPVRETEIILKDIGPVAAGRIRVPSGERTGLFASNGSGKTFITRALALMSRDPESTWVRELDRSRIIRWGQTSGSVEVKRWSRVNGTNTQEENRKIVVRPEAEFVAPPVSSDDTLVHVFSSDFVRRVVQVRNYSPNADVSGSVTVTFGETEAEIADLEATKASIDRKAGETRERVFAKVNHLKSELNNEGVSKHLTEWTAISVDNVTRTAGCDRTQEINAIRAKLTRIGGEIDRPELTLPALPTERTGALRDLIRFLRTPVSGENLDADFLETIRDRSTEQFIRLGVQIQPEPEVCPYCKQVLQVDARALLSKYREFVTSRLGEAKQEADRLIGTVDRFSAAIGSWLQQARTYTREASALSNQLVADLSDDISPPSIDSDRIRDALSSIRRGLTRKREDLAEVVQLPRSIITQAAVDSKVAKQWTNRAGYNRKQLLEQFERRKERRKELHREFCELYCEHLAHELTNDFATLEALSRDLSEIEEKIAELRSRYSQEKRDLVAESLGKCLRSVYGDRVQLESQSMRLSITAPSGTRSVDEAHEYYLSDGERSILAFCYYIAAVHEIVDRIEDYRRILFVVDDPVSSLDFRYVYSLMAMMKEPEYFVAPGTQKPNEYRPRGTLLLSHSHELYNALRANGIIKHWYTIENARLVSLKRQLLLPYDEHLSHIANVVDDDTKLSFHTPNSCRHVVETIASFLYPNLSQSERIKLMVSDMDLSGSGAINALHDNSHGRLRSTPPAEETLIRACRDIIDYVSANFSGQLEHAKASGNERSSEEP